MDNVECKHNHGVGCENQTKCAACGWNPAVAQRRLQEIREARANNGQVFRVPAD